MVRKISRLLLTFIFIISNIFGSMSFINADELNNNVIVEYPDSRGRIYDDRVRVTIEALYNGEDRYLTEASFNSKRIKRVEFNSIYTLDFSQKYYKQYDVYLNSTGNAGVAEAIAELSQYDFVFRIAPVYITQIDEGEEKSAVINKVMEGEKKDYSDKAISVCIKHKYSGYGYNKEFSKEDFPGIDIDYIDFSLMMDPEKALANELINHEKYKQIMTLYLKNPGIDEVNRAMEALSVNPLVYKAAAVCITPIDYDDPSYPTSTPIPTEEKKLIIGDVDWDGVLSAKDALEILKISARINLPSDAQRLVCDLDENEVINATDALEVLKRAASL